MLRLFYFACQKSLLPSSFWQRCLEPRPFVLNPLECSGWILDDDSRLAINWMSGLPAPDVVLKFLSSKCKYRCVLPSCTCLSGGLNCIDACALQDCETMKITEHMQVDSDNEADDTGTEN